MPYTSVQSNQGYNVEPGVDWAKMGLYAAGTVVGYGVLRGAGKALGRGWASGAGQVRRTGGRIAGAGRYLGRKASEGRANFMAGFRGPSAQSAIRGTLEIAGPGNRAGIGAGARRARIQELRPRVEARAARAARAGEAVRTNRNRISNLRSMRDIKNAMAETNFFAGPEMAQPRTVNRADPLIGRLSSGGARSRLERGDRVRGIVQRLQGAAKSIDRNDPLIGRLSLGGSARMPAMDSAHDISELVDLNRRTISSRIRNLPSRQQILNRQARRSPSNMASVNRNWF